MNRRFFALLFIVCAICALLFTAGCVHEDTSATPQIHTLTPSEAREMMEEMQEMEIPYIILDVRTQAEFTEGYISGATNIPLDEMTADTMEEFHRDMPIFLYCRSGRRSQEAARLLLDLGFIHIYDFGGILSWSDEVVVP